VADASVTSRVADASVTSRVADASVTSRVDGDGGRAFGTLPPGLDLAAIVDRARPAA
jgi:putative acyl-CoA dehydrogenase